MPLTHEDLQRVWETITDRNYVESILKAGDGGGLEAYGQLFEQLERVSAAISSTSQALFILPFSGQEADPAMGEAHATVSVTVSRTATIDQPLILGSGQVWVEEQARQWGEDPGSTGTLALTGRAYTPTNDLVMMPGTASSTATFTAEKPGFGYNNPLPNSISLVRQPAASLYGDLGLVSVEGSNDWLYDQAGTLSADLVGQYVEFTGGANIGIRRRAASFQAGRLSLERSAVVRGTMTGTPIAGEMFQQGDRLARIAAWQSSYALLVDVSGGTYDATAMVGLQSGAQFTPTTAPGSMTLAADPSCSWRVVRWSEFGLSTSHASSPTGGRLGMLDMLGHERQTPRNHGESDTDYRRRVATMQDVVSPAAVLRSVGRALRPFGIGTEPLLEAGQTGLPGIYFDAPGDAPACAYDLDAQRVTGLDPYGFPASGYMDGERVLQVNADGVASFGYAAVDPQSGVLDSVVGIEGSFAPLLPIFGLQSGASFVPLAGNVGPGLRSVDRYRYAFSGAEMRAFFLVQVPQVGLGDFGLAYDAGEHDAYDLGNPYQTAMDGYPVQQYRANLSAFTAADQARAAGVGHDVVPA